MFISTTKMSSLQKADCIQGGIIIIAFALTSRDIETDDSISCIFMRQKLEEAPYLCQ